MRNHATLLVVSLVLSVIGSVEGLAQQAGSFEQLQLLVKPGDTVSVTDLKGTLNTGRITELSTSVLRLQVDGAIRDLSQNDVLEIKQRRTDSLANGAKIGALVGTGAGILGAIGLCIDSEA